MLTVPAAGRRETGFTLVELLVTLALTATMMMMAAPYIGAWMQNNQIRAAAESLQTGLQTAKAEAVRRNTLATFQLMTSLDNGCARSTTGPDWVISLDNASGSCGSAPSETVAPRIVQRRAGTEGSAVATFAASQAAITFNGLGRVTPVPANDITIGVNTSAGSCLAAGGTLRCLRVTITPMGQVRMCDPTPSLPTGDPRRC